MKIVQNLFEEDFDVQRILTALSVFARAEINPEDTLIVFDEIQSAVGGITALKYFYEDASQYHIIAAGSLLGMNLHQNTSFPVGKVDFLIQTEEKIIPIEVKSETNVNSVSFQVFL